MFLCLTSFIYPLLFIDGMKKAVIIGTGAVGSTAAYALMKDGAADEIVLIDVCKDLAEGHAMDLCHGMEFVPNAKIHAADYSACKDADIIVICAGLPRKPEETRLDLINKNAAILKDIISKIIEFNKDCILLLVANPVDVLTHLAIKYSGFPPNKVFGTGTMLDTARFKFLLGEHFNAETSTVDALVLGEHGATAFPWLSAAKIDGKNLEITPEVLDIFENTKKSAAEVISKKGATYYAIGLCIAKVVNAVLKDEEITVPVSTLLPDHNVCLSMPCRINKDGIKEQIKIDLNEEEKKALEKSANALKEVVDNVTS